MLAEPTPAGRFRAESLSSARALFSHRAGWIGKSNFQFHELLCRYQLGSVALFLLTIFSLDDKTEFLKKPVISGGRWWPLSWVIAGFPQFSFYFFVPQMARSLPRCFVGRLARDDLTVPSVEAELWLGIYINSNDWISISCDNRALCSSLVALEIFAQREWERKDEMNVDWINFNYRAWTHVKVGADGRSRFADTSRGKSSINRPQHVRKYWANC